ncbi:translation initiation factor IF-1 [Candidatus Parcubacteria bacterium]|nr:translation initiation factor IF-1 [Candidatus Parcubacteria bacterium]
MKEQKIIKVGTVIESLPNATFKVELEGEKTIILCYLGGKMKLNRIKVIPGDKVKVEISNYNPQRGRIIYRL